MFTGIITDVGRIAAVDDQHGRKLTIKTALPLAEIPIGGSIATSGICFTVVEKEDDWFSVVASGATLEVTTAGRWRVGDKVNLERSLRIGDELGGHIVFGHVDAVGKVSAFDAIAESHRLEIEIPKQLAPLVAVKGSVTIDGISLTVNEATSEHAVINIIPHTLLETNLGDRRPGDLVNVEIDMLARYVSRQLAFQREIQS